ncbi:MAG: hypothetical protein L0322_05800, partial [Chloroflexi bacterium]|nr:hypothetical protein [Chloroflexota bacterium]
MNRSLRIFQLHWLLLICLAAGCPAAAQDRPPAGTPPGQTTLISVTPAGEVGNMPSEYPTLSADGRYLAFHSKASNLAPNDGNNARDIFIYNRLSETLTLISRTPAGQSSSGDSAFPDFSADGRIVAFHSIAGDLIAGDSNGTLDIYVYDQQSGDFE